MNARSVMAAVMLSTLLPVGAALANEPEDLEEAAPSQLEYAPQDVAMIGFDSALHSFGEVESGALLEHDFFFINNGTTELIIEKAFSRNSGTSVMASHQPLETGEIGKISVKVDTTGLTGDQTVRIKVESNAYNAPSTLYLKAHMLPAAE